MSPSLFFDNKKFISAKEASLLTGYSHDYIGQLARGNKIDSKRIGHSWYVGEESILNHKNFPNQEIHLLNKIQSPVPEIAPISPSLGVKIPNKKILLARGKWMLFISSLILTALVLSVNNINFSKVLKNISSISENFLSAASIKSTPNLITTSYNSLASAFKNYVSPTSKINISDLITAYKNYLSRPIPSLILPLVKGEMPKAVGVNISDLVTAYQNYVSKPTKIIYARGPAGPSGPLGLQGPQGPAGNSLDPSIYVPRTFFDGQVDSIFSSIGNSTRGLADSLAKEVDTKLLTVSGNATVGGALTSSGASTIGTGASLTNNFGTGTGAINTFGEATGTNAINGSTTILGNTLINSTGIAATTIGNSTGALTIISGGTSAWTATPTISGLITATSGLTSNGPITIQNDSNFTQTGIGTFGTGTGAVSLNGDVTLASGKTLSTTGKVTLGYIPNSTTDYTLAAKPTATNPASKFLYNGSYTDTAIMMGLNTDYKYYGHTTKYTGIYLTLATPGLGYNLVTEYSKGGNVWGAVTVTDDTSNLTTNGSIYFAPPSDWATDTVNGATDYWIRLSSTTSPTATAITSQNSILPTGYALATYLGPFDTTPKFYVDYRGNVQVTTLLIAQDLSVIRNVVSDLIPGTTNNNDLGSSSNYWKTGYINTLNASNIVAANTEIGGTKNETFTLNSDNSPANPDQSLVFSRTNSPNPVLGWNEGSETFTLNGPLTLSSGTGTAILTLPGTINTTGGSIQTNTVTRIDNAGNLSNIGTYASSVTPAGSTAVDLLSATLTNNTDSGIQRGLALTIAGSGVTENGIYLNHTGVGTGINALEIAGTWTNALIIPSGAGSVGIGTTTPDATSILDLTSTTKGFLSPRMTTAQKNAILTPATGLTIYDTDLNKLNVYNGTTWKNVGSAEIGGEITSGTAGSILFVNPTGILAQDNANLSYNPITHILTATGFSGPLTGDVTGHSSLDLPLSGGTMTGQLTSTLATGTAPFSVTSTTPVTNLSIGGNAGTVTTNATLTGVITSIGNATSIASQTGTGTKFVVDTAPTFATSITTPSVLATANDSGALGASGTAFSDLFLASGGVINWAAGDATLTHSTGLLTSNVPLSLGITNALTAGSIELGHATDTTLARVSAGVISVEGIRIIASAGTTSGTILKNNGTTFVASTETYAAPGTLGNVMTSDGTNWTSSVPASSSAFSGLTVATTTNTIDNTNYAQTWNWSTANTQNPLTMNFNALTTGSALSLLTSNASLASTNGFFRVANTGAATGASPFVRLQPNSTADSGITLTNAGNVGVGTSAPGYALDVNGSAAFGSGTEVMRIASNGNVGIGNTAPLQKLSVTGASVVASGADGIAGIFSITTGTGINVDNKLLAGVHDGDYSWIQAAQPGTAYRNLVLQALGGNVGIGTTTPGAPLEVKGNATHATIAKFTDFTDTTSCTLSSGGLIACSSDARLKKNVADITYGLSTVMSLRPVLYNWNYEADGSVKNLGFIAQEVEALVPKLISTDEEGMKSLNSIGMVPILVKAIQEMNLNLEGVAGTVTPILDSPSESFVTAFFNNIKTIIGTWLADAGNGIASIFAKQVTTDTLCVSDASGAKTCINKAQLDSLLANAGSSTPTCTAPQTLVNNVCTDPAPVIPTCVLPQTLVNNVCTDPAPTPSNLSILITAKATAQGLITAKAVESETPGDHIIGALTTLTEANTAASATSADTQSVIDGQVTALNAAINVYNLAIVSTP